MVNARYYKLFNLRYDKDSNVGKLMYDARQQGFEKKGKGAMIGDDAARMFIGSSDADYPILGKDMTTDDLIEAKFAMLSKYPCTVLDLEQWRYYAWDRHSGGIFKTLFLSSIKRVVRFGMVA